MRDYFLEENSKSIITDAMNNSEPLNSIILMKLLKNHYQNSPNGLKRMVQKLRALTTLLNDLVLIFNTYMVTHSFL